MSINYLYLVLGIFAGLFFGFVTATILFTESAESMIEKVKIENLGLEFNQTMFQDFLNETFDRLVVNSTNGAR